jgi:hypothetical protein
MSGLAAHGATDPRIVTGGLVGLGVCQLVTALGLRPVAIPGRLVLALGGAVTLLGTAFPQPANGSATSHGVAAAIGFVAIAVWPAFCVRGPGDRPPLPPGVFLGVAGALLALVVWFGAELLFVGGRAGLAERAAAGAETVWPLVLVAVLRARPRTGDPGRLNGP